MLLELGASLSDDGPPARLAPSIGDPSAFVKPTIVSATRRADVVVDSTTALSVVIVLLSSSLEFISPSIADGSSTGPELDSSNDVVWEEDSLVALVVGIKVEAVEDEDGLEDVKLDVVESNVVVDGTKVVVELSVVVSNVVVVEPIDCVCD